MEKASSYCTAADVVNTIHGSLYQNTLCKQKHTEREINTSKQSILTPPASAGTTSVEIEKL